MVFDDVARHPRLFVEAPATLDADLLGHGDLHVVDVLAAPDRLEEQVGEPQDEQILHRLLAEIVVDAKDLGLVEGRRDRIVERLGAREVVSERLLEHHPREGAAAALAARGRDEPGCPQTFDDGAELARWDGQIKEAIFARAALDVGAFELRAERRVGRRVLRRAADVAQASLEVGPRPLVDGLAAREGGYGGTHLRAKCLVRLVAPRDPDHGEAPRQGSAPRQVVERRHQLAARQVTRGAEDDHSARVSRPCPPPTHGEVGSAGWAVPWGRAST